MGVAGKSQVGVDGWGLKGPQGPERPEWVRRPPPTPVSRVPQVTRVQTVSFAGLRGHDGIIRGKNAFAGAANGLLGTGRRARNRMVNDDNVLTYGMLCDILRL